MYFISQTASESGYYGNPHGEPFDGAIALPDALLDEFIGAKGFVIPTVQDGTVTALTVNQAALDAYLAEHPVLPPQPAEPSADEILDILLGGETDE